MYILSFRDMALPRCGAVTSAAVYKLDPVDAEYAWEPANAPSLRLVGWDEVLSNFRGKHALFVVHGFNVDRDNGYTGLGAFAQELCGEGPLPGLQPPYALDAVPQGFDLVVPVLWPGDWYLPINYPFVLPDARATGRNLADFLLSSGSRLARASFFSHSFGIRVVLEAMQAACASPSAYARPVFDTAIFTAGAASDTVLDDPYYADAIAAVGQIAVVSAMTDQVLSASFPIGNPVEQALWADDPGPDVALGHAGPRLTVDSPARAKSSWYDVGRISPYVDQQHGDYLPAPIAPVPPLPNGWSDKRIRIATLAQAVMTGCAPPWPELAIPQP